MSECIPVSTHLPLNLNLGLLDCPDEVDSKLQAEYRAIVGSLVYLYQWTRPDLGFTVTFFIKLSTQTWCQIYASSQAHSKVFERYQRSWYWLHKRSRSSVRKRSKAKYTLCSL